MGTASEERPAALAYDARRADPGAQGTSLGERRHQDHGEGDHRAVSCLGEGAQPWSRQRHAGQARANPRFVGSRRARILAGAGGPPRRRARGALAQRRQEKQAKRTGHDDADEPDLDPAWRVLPLVRGRKAILLGGDPREPNRERLEQALQLSSLEWPSIDGPRKVESVVERIGKQAYGLVLVLQTFVAHKQSEPIIEAAKAAGIPWALVAGYGVQAVKLGLERFLGGPRSGVSASHEDDPEGHDAERHAPGGGGPR